MKIAILHGPQDLRIEERALNPDNLQPDQLWVKTELSAFKIGTDRGNYEGAEQVPGAPDYPRWVGDSNLGIIQGTGSAVTRFQTGDRVVANMPHQSEYFINETGPVVRIPDQVDSEDAVYGFLYALSALCYRKAHFQIDETVAVVGLGVLGMGAVALGSAYGARVIAIGNSDTRLQWARDIGAYESLHYNDPELCSKIDQLPQHAGIDLVIQTANPWPAYQTSVEIVRPGGRVSIVALPGRGELPLDLNPLDMKWFYNKGISLIAVSGQAGELYPGIQESPVQYPLVDHVLNLMADHKLAPKRLITHRMHYTEMAKAYEMALARDKSILGVIFQWNDSS